MPEHDSMIGPSEEAAAVDPTVGDGTPDTAPERDATYGAPLAHPRDYDEDEEGTMVNPVGGGPRAVHATEMQPGKLSPKAALAFLLPARSRRGRGSSGFSTTSTIRARSGTTRTTATSRSR
jgi:hypothetical protein